MSILKTSAILIKARKYKEKDKLLTFLTEDFGKIITQCKGARDPLNHWGHNAEPPNLCWLQLYERNNFYIVTEMKPINNLFSIMQEYPRVLAFETMAHLLDMVLEPGVPLRETFALSLSFLKALNRKESDPFYLSYLYIILFLGKQGYPLQMRRCIVCSEPFSREERGYTVSYEEGGLICSRCRKKVSVYNPLTTEFCSFLQVFGACSDFEVVNQPIDFFHNMEELDRIVREYFRYKFNRKLLTMISLRKL